MDIDIDHLDPEEKSKISALLKERQLNDNDKGVASIFRKMDEKEEFLCGKKVDLNMLLKDDKAVMGETEEEFTARMKRRKMIAKMREDPMAIMQMNEQRAIKIAMKKDEIHQRNAKRKQKKKPEVRSRSSSSDSGSDDSDGFLHKLKELLRKEADSDTSIKSDNELKKRRKRIRSKSKDHKRNIDTSSYSRYDSSKDRRERKREGFSNDRRNSNEYSKDRRERKSDMSSNNRRYSRYESRKDRGERKSDKSSDNRRYSTKRRERSRSKERRENKEAAKSNLTLEEKEALRRKMQEDAKSMHHQCDKIREGYIIREYEEEKELNKTNMNDEFFLLKARSEAIDMGIAARIKNTVVNNKVRNMFNKK